MWVMCTYVGKCMYIPRAGDRGSCTSGEPARTDGEVLGWPHSHSYTQKRGMAHRSHPLKPLAVAFLVLKTDQELEASIMRSLSSSLAFSPPSRSRLCPRASSDKSPLATSHCPRDTSLNTADSSFCTVFELLRALVPGHALSSLSAVSLGQGGFGCVDDDDISQ